MFLTSEKIANKFALEGWIFFHEKEFDFLLYVHCIRFFIGTWKVKLNETEINETKFCIWLKMEEREYYIWIVNTKSKSEF